jgi:hypothetical protein
MWLLFYHKILTVSCKAEGGKPAPNVVLIINGQTLANQIQLVQHILTVIDRSYDRTTVTCQASNLFCIKFCLCFAFCFIFYNFYNNIVIQQHESQARYAYFYFYYHSFNQNQNTVFLYLVTLSSNCEKWKESKSVHVEVLTEMKQKAKHKQNLIQNRFLWKYKISRKHHPCLVLTILHH